jgi:hypothetical protein
LRGPPESATRYDIIAALQARLAVEDNPEIIAELEAAIETAGVRPRGFREVN